MIQLPQRPHRSSRGMLILCALVFIGLAGIFLFLNRTGAQSKDETSTVQKSMSQPTSSSSPSQNANEGDLRKKLTPEQYRVTQMCGTEPPFQNKYWDNHARGLYVDVVSGEALFTSMDKFDSGSGWPSFTKPIATQYVKEIGDSSHGMDRMEVKSSSSNSHLGHVFEDGPTDKGGLRYCINSASLRFIPVEKLKEEGYGRYLELFEKAGEKK